MARILASDLSHYLNQPVELRGWLNNVRAFGKLNFLILRDRSGFAQIVIEDKAEYQKIASLQAGSVLRVKGTAVPSSHAELGVEVIQPSLEVEVPVQEAPLVEYYKPEIPSDLEFILDHRPIALRNRQLQAVFKIQAEMTHAFRLYMHDVVKAVEYFAPNMIGASSEGGCEFFNVDFFGYPATLAQSSQLYKQIMVGVNERVYALMPFFRAENSNTTRHLTEGKQFEFEMGFFEDWHEILDVQEGCLKFMINHLQTTCAPEIKTLGNQLVRAPLNVPFPRLTFAEAQEIYFKRTGIDERQEPDLSPAAEKELCRYAFEEFGTDLIFITDWLTSKRPFYAYPTDGHPILSNTFDLLCGGTEITSGGQRRHMYDSMIEGIKSKGMDPANFTDYLSIFKYGMPPHGGFGMGLERLTMTLLGLKNIREASLFPSDPKRIAGNRIKAKIFFGSENIRNEIIRLIKKNEMEFQHLVHNPAATAEASTAASGAAREGGIKSLILKGKNTRKNYQISIPSTLKLDMKVVAEMVGEKCEFEDPAIVSERFGLIVGAVPPFGHLLNLDTFFDERISQAEHAIFSCGLQTESIKMRSKDLVALVQPKFGRLAKE
ncbi:aspartate--tRNA(Asn) ligase [Candidatus Protochlamydia phocaeensis]|uniref:aspartate--tRNA(Asn) ligase n=1 Tax=Candidatus Protochlamydia phocaeensis TaxID=1414722 RepID=UPI000837F386|nr:aspartate--tRNA(Asn) ligase [Candidatus Protochlamydia phocaeensis]